MLMSLLRLPGGGLSVVALLVLFACQKDKLPPETQEGKNTFGCKINGKNWVPTGAPGNISGGKYPAVNGGFYQIGTDPTLFLYIRAYKDEESVQLFARNVTKVGNYQLNFLTDTKPTALYPQNYGTILFGATEFVTTNIHTGIINVTKADTLSGLISGTFEFTAVNRLDPNKTIQVTSGRFDIKP